MKEAPNPGLIINSYNQPDYLARVLNALSAQKLSPGEVLLADDGSFDETKRVFETWADGQRMRCGHVWQEHEGFRRARILNQAIAQAQSDYLIFLDGDTVPHPWFVADHQKLARETFFVQGHRALIERKGAEWFGLGKFNSDRRRALWTGQLRGLKHAYRWPVPLRKRRRDLRGVRGCNLAIWKRDLIKVNGYNEAFVGWGREDSDLALRLMNAGVGRLDARGWALCYHLWHPPASRAGLEQNEAILKSAQESGGSWCVKGVGQYL
jgi:glycosyltransferase involved in cell wall biosynthesis